MVAIRKKPKPRIISKKLLTEARQLLKHLETEVAKSGIINIRFDRDNDSGELHHNRDER